MALFLFFLTKMIKVQSVSISIILAMKDLWHDKNVTFCLVVSLASVLAPLLLLFGLKYGIISTMEEQFLQDPLKREIIIKGNYNLDQVWFKKIKQQPQVGFIIPLTRSLNTQLDIIKDPRNFLQNIELIPTDENDPLLFETILPPVNNNEILLSHTVALKLNVKKNDSVKLSFSRKRDGVHESNEITVQILGVLPESVFNRDGVFTHFELLKAVEDFRDGYAIAEFEVSTGKPRLKRTVFARARLFANNLDDVAPLADYVRSTGIEVRTHAKDIADIQQTEKLLSFICMVIAWVALLGCAISLAGSMITNIDRKRQNLAMLRLLGFPSLSIALYPMLQSLFIATMGFALAGGAYMVGAVAFNSSLGLHMQESGFICRLSWQHVLVAFLTTHFVALIAATIGAYRAVQIEPAETFREH